MLLARKTKAIIHMSYDTEKPSVTEMKNPEIAFGATQEDIVFGYAQTLAAFAGLEPSAVIDFRKNHRDFVPRLWWEYRNQSGRLLWQSNQVFLQEVWEKQFDIGQFELIRLITSVFNPAWLTDVMFRTKERPSYATVLEMPEEFYPYQQAVLFLVADKWRARVCKRCTTRFVAKHNRREYCDTVWNTGETCTILARRGDHKRDHQKHREERNRKKRGAYARQFRSR